VFEIVVIAHFAFIVWVVTGGFVAIKWWWVSIIHLPAMVWAFLLELYGWICPLTPLENELRAARGMDVYDTGFIENYLIPVIYPAGLTREIQVMLAAGLIAVNLVAYALVVRRHFFNRIKQRRNE
jgi:hypothetical protein